MLFLKSIKLTTIFAGGSFFYLLLQNFGVVILEADWNTFLNVICTIVVFFGIGTDARKKTP
jgi:hypothetical protein